MERDNEAIELQFVAGQRELMMGHYCEARHPFKRVQGPSARAAPVLFTVTAGICVTARQPPVQCWKHK